MKIVAAVCQQIDCDSTKTINSIFALWKLIMWWWWTVLLVVVAAAKETSIEHQRVTNCDVVLYASTSLNGSIQSPFYPGIYPPRSFCRYEFQGTEKQRVQIVFSEFSLSGEVFDCQDSDVLMIYMVMNGKYELVETLCGGTVPKPVMSNGPKMRIEFRGKQGGRNQGFKAEYSFLKNFGISTGQQQKDKPCTFIYNSSESSSGWIYSPNFPGAYPRNIECNYHFHGAPQERVNIRFTYFDVEGIAPCEMASASDYVEMSNFESVDRKFDLYCGQKRDFTIRSDGRFFRITLKSNHILDGTGFKASYVFEKDEGTTDKPIPMVKSRSNKYRYSFRLSTVSILMIVAVTYGGLLESMVYSIIT